MSTIAVNAITDASAGNTTTINGVTPNTSNVIGKNLVINGAMQIAQRGTSGSTSSTGYLSVDRFIVNANGTSVTLAQSSDAPANTGLEYSMSFTRTASGQDFRHAVELPADGKAGRLDETLTVSYYAKINTGTANGTFQYRYAASALGGGNTQTVTTSDSLTTTWQRFTHTFTNADTVAAGDLSFSMLWSVDTNCTMYITGVQLEVGDAATEFEHRPYTTELQLCQRYFEKFAPGLADGTTIYVGSYASSPGGSAGTWYFKQEMRAIPTISLGSGGSTANTISRAHLGVFTGVNTYARIITPATASAEL
tara:strand:+ start:767 stop:1693 length:927 start_codon:yes stop_codon:yes gene_type:complete